MRRAFADSLGSDLEDFQSNHEGKLISRVHEAMGKVDFIVINAGAFTHTSVAHGNLGLWLRHGASARVDLLQIAAARAFQRCCLLTLSRNL